MKSVTESTIERLLLGGELTTSVSLHEQCPTYCPQCATAFGGGLVSMQYNHFGFMFCDNCTHLCARSRKKLMYQCERLMKMIREIRNGRGADV